MNDNTPTDHSTPKPLSLQDAYDHLYHEDKFEWESDDEFAARKLARKHFDQQLNDAGMTIDALVSMGQIKLVKHTTPLLDKLMKRI